MFQVILEVDDIPGLSSNVKGKIKSFANMMTTFMAMKGMGVITHPTDT